MPQDAIGPAGMPGPTREPLNKFMITLVYQLELTSFMSAFLSAE